MQEPAIKSENKRLISLAGLTVFLGIGATMFGFGYQKGLLVAMNLGNLSPNYEIRETANSAVLGLMYILNKIHDTALSSSFNHPSTWIIAIMFAVFGLGFAHTKRVHHINKDAIPFKKATEFFTATYHKLSRSYTFAAITGGLIGFVTSMSAKVLLLTLLSFSILPGVLGYLVGIQFISEEKTKPSCGDVSDLNQNGKFLNQCTQININGKKIRGEITLETKDSYFVKLNESFLYITKDGKNCMYSKFVKRESVDAIDDFEFPNSQVDDICTG